MMFSSLIIFSVIHLLSSSTASTRPDHPVLKYFELLHVSDLRHNIISNIPRSEEPWIRQIHFYSLGRSFSLHLEPRINLFSPKFKVQLINSTGHFKPYSLNTNRFYQGHLIGDNSSFAVTAHLADTGLVTAHIVTHNETYYIEPAHYHFGESYHQHMIAYRKSDAQHSHLSGTVDYVITPEPIIKVDHSKLSDPFNPNLLKREQPLKDTCSIVVVADYRFFDFLRSSESNVIDTIVSRIDAADRLSFRPAQWIINANGDTITGRGLQIGAIIIHTEPSSESTHYNSIDNALNIQDLLRRFSRNNWSDYCLAHLMTHRTFPSSKLGLAYIASPAIEETGGICSTRVLEADTLLIVTYNTGISIVSAGDRLLLPSEAELVIAHEIGHSWGSAHDPGNDRECAFDYLMNEFAQDGSNTKHRDFSSCSLVSIGRVLVNKATCFDVKSVSMCGNFIIDEGEECDEGSVGGVQADGVQSCCTADCLLMDGRNCSDVNHPCCIDCQIAPVGSKVCHIVGSVSRDCTSLTTCNGILRDCPEPNQAEVNSRCIDGICLYQDDTNTSIECVPFCQVVGMDTCSCTGDEQCLECCLTKNDECQPLNFTGELVPFPDGVFCSTGFCNNGVCIDSSQDFASQLWSVITALDINEYAQFIKENIIGFVLLIVTMIWVPGSCLFYYLCDVKKVWKRCLHRSSLESPDNYYTTAGPVFETQTSWTQVKPELKPLLSVDDDDIPVEEPVDDLPLPKGFTNESVVMTFESTM